MLLSSRFNVVCRFASQGSFPISCYNSSHPILFLKFGGILKFVNSKNLKFVFSIYDADHGHSSHMKKRRLRMLRWHTLYSCNAHSDHVIRFIICYFQPTTQYDRPAQQQLLHFLLILWQLSQILNSRVRFDRKEWGLVWPAGWACIRGVV